MIRKGVKGLQTIKIWYMDVSVSPNKHRCPVLQSYTNKMKSEVSVVPREGSSYHPERGRNADA